MSTIRQAILLAALHIERNPEEFNFMRTKVPDGPNCGTPGCAAGWIAAFYNALAGTKFHMFDQPLELPVMDLVPYTDDSIPRYDIPFYSRMDSVCPASTTGLWRRDAQVCADTLRAYADRFHPAEAEAAPPATVAAPVREEVLA